MPNGVANRARHWPRVFDLWRRILPLRSQSVVTLHIHLEVQTGICRIFRRVGHGRYVLAGVDRGVMESE